MWGDACTVVKTIKAHAPNAHVTSITTEGDKIISGSKDLKIAIISSLTSGNYKLERLIDLSNIGTGPMQPKSIDFFNGNLLVG